MKIKFKNKYINFNHCKDADDDELMDFVGYNRGVRDTLQSFSKSVKESDELQKEFLKAQISFPDKIVKIKDNLRKMLKTIN